MILQINQNASHHQEGAPQHVPMTAGIITAARDSQPQTILRKVSFEDDQRPSITNDSLQLPIQRQVSFEEYQCPSPASVSLQAAEQQPSSTQAPVPIPLELTSYWYSSSAKKLFQPMQNETAQQAVDNMIDILERATASNDPENCLSIIKGYDYVQSKPQLTFFDRNDLDRVFAKAVYLRGTLKLARETIHQGKAFSFLRCAHQVIETIGDHFEPYAIKGEGTVLEWFRDFRIGRGFSHYKIKNIMDFFPLLSFFRQDPDLYKLFHLQLTSNLSQLSSKTAHELFFKNIAPVASAKRGHAQPERFLAEFGLDRLHYIHFHRWMNFEGFVDRYCPETNMFVWVYLPN